MNNSFLKQFSENIKFKYFCFDRVIIRGYILSMFFPAGIVRFLRAVGFKGLLDEAATRGKIKPNSCMLL